MAFYGTHVCLESSIWEKTLWTIYFICLLYGKNDEKRNIETHIHHSIETQVDLSAIEVCNLKLMAIGSQVFDMTSTIFSDTKVTKRIWEHGDGNSCVQRI